MVTIAALVKTWRAKAKTDLRRGIAEALGSYREHCGCVNAALAYAECADELDTLLASSRSASVSPKDEEPPEGYPCKRCAKLILAAEVEARRLRAERQSDGNDC